MAKSKQKTIKIDCEFEKQGKESKFELDFKKTNKFKILYTDGYYVIVTDKVTHKDNDDAVEAVLYDANNTIKSYNWANSRVDEVQYYVYNWLMNLESTDNNVYILTFKRGREVGGGFL